MKTYSPIRGMYVCQNDTGNYVSKADYDALLSKALDILDAMFAEYADISVDDWCRDSQIRPAVRDEFIKAMQN